MTRAALISDCGPKVDAARYDEGYRLGESQQPKSNL